LFSSVLFLMVVVFVLNLMVHFTNMDINIMGILWVSFGFIALTLLTLVFICKKTEDKKGCADYKYHHLKYNYLRQFKTNIWCWVYSRFFKILQISNCINISKQVNNPDKPADNHSFHKDNLPEDNKPCQPKTNDTFSS